VIFTFYEWASGWVRSGHDFRASDRVLKIGPAWNSLSCPSVSVLAVGGRLRSSAAVVEIVETMRALEVVLSIRPGDVVPPETIDHRRSSLECGRRRRLRTRSVHRVCLPDRAYNDATIISRQVDERNFIDRMLFRNANSQSVYTIALFPVSITATE